MISFFLHFLVEKAILNEFDNLSIVFDMKIKEIYKELSLEELGPKLRNHTTKLSAKFLIKKECSPEYKKLVLRN